ncbi:transposase [Streptomyces sp. NPDC057020]|uniref:transposase n=1 Tax=unclassified Streptomyces TaxID=2593676 RepID=UPI0036257361
MGRGDLTDEQWAVLEPLLPRGPGAGRPPVWPRRQLIDGIRFRVRTGVPWRDIPVEYGPWNRVYDLFRRRQRNGTWQRILRPRMVQGIGAPSGFQPKCADIDSSTGQAVRPSREISTLTRGAWRAEGDRGVNSTEPRSYADGRSSQPARHHHQVAHAARRSVMLASCGTRRTR